MYDTNSIYALIAPVVLRVCVGVRVVYFSVMISRLSIPLPSVCPSYNFISLRELLQNVLYPSSENCGEGDSQLDPDQIQTCLDPVIVSLLKHCTFSEWHSLQERRAFICAIVAFDLFGDYTNNKVSPRISSPGSGCTDGVLWKLLKHPDLHDFVIKVVALMGVMSCEPVGRYYFSTNTMESSVVCLCEFLKDPELMFTPMHGQVLAALQRISIRPSTHHILVENGIHQWIIDNIHTSSPVVDTTATTGIATPILLDSKQGYPDNDRTDETAESEDDACGQVEEGGGTNRGVIFKEFCIGLLLNISGSFVGQRACLQDDMVCLLLDMFEREDESINIREYVRLILFNLLPYPKFQETAQKVFGIRDIIKNCIHNCDGGSDEDNSSLYIEQMTILLERMDTSTCQPEEVFIDVNKEDTGSFLDNERMSQWILSRTTTTAKDGPTGTTIDSITSEFDYDILSRELRIHPDDRHNLQMQEKVKNNNDYVGYMYIYTSRFTQHLTSRFKMAFHISNSEVQATHRKYCQPLFLNKN